MKHFKEYGYIAAFALLMFLNPTSKYAYAGILGPSNYWECILENIPGIQNDNAARALVRNCSAKFKNSKPIEKRSGWFGPSNRDECIIEYGKNVSGEFSSRLLFSACNNLYD